MKKIVLISTFILLSCNIAKADFAQHYNLGQQYLTQYQYSSAISEFKKALRINYLDNSARIGLVNSYLARGTYFANNDKNWESAANDYRAALFYLKYYPSGQESQNSAQAIQNTTDNLNQCLNMQKFNTTAGSRYQKGQQLRLQGLFAEAGYEFAQSVTDPNLRAKSYEQIADIMKVMGNNEQSSEYYRKATALNQSNAGLRLKYAIVLDKSGRGDEAVKEYNYALANGCEDPEISYALERIYRQKLAQAPNDAPTMTNLGAILQKQNKYDEALQYYTKAGQTDPTNITTRLNIGTLYQQKKSYDSAIAAYDSILFTYPDNIEANLYKSQCLAAMGRTEEASAGFKKVLALSPNNKDAKTQILDTLKETMAPKQYIAYLNKNYTTDKNAVNDMYDYAVELHKENKFPDAIYCYNEVLKLKTDNPEIYVNLAIAHKQNNDTENAKLILAEAKTRFPNNQQIIDNIKSINQEIVSTKLDEASAYFNSGDFQKAIDVYQSIQPPTFDSLSAIAACYKSLNNDEKAIEFYQRALNSKPNSDIAYYLGVLYSEKEDWNASKNYLKKAIEINPQNQKAKELYESVAEQDKIKLVNEAIDYYEKNNYPKALSIFNKILQDDPKNAYSYYYRGLIQDSMKKYPQAISDYKKAIQYSKDLPIVYYLLGLDYEAISEFKNALINYKKYVSLTPETNEYKTYAQSRIKALKKYEN